VGSEYDRIDDCVEGQTDPEPFSGAVHLSVNREVLFQDAYGLAIRSEAFPNRPDTRFQIASGSKVFTGVAICQLVEAGKINFDTPLLECTDIDFPHYPPELTIRHLLTHSSGITSYFEEDVDPDYEALWREVPVYRIRRPRDFLPMFRSKRMKFTPGERFEYNDGGFILLGLVIENLTGTEFQACIRERVFGPAGMADSGYFPADRLPERTAYAYIEEDDGSWRTNVFAVPPMGAPDGGAYTTGADMAAFWNALSGNRLLGEKTTRAMLEPQMATSLGSPYTDYGYGVWIDRSETGIRKIFVEGQDPGVAMRSAFYPSRGLVLTVLGNTSDALWPLFRDIERALHL
jgi:CubicO group peptidase (beta-lactamase class C family)